MKDEVPASEEDEESGEMVADEEKVVRVEDDVVEEVDEEVGNAVLESEVLRRGVERSEGDVGIGEERS